MSVLVGCYRTDARRVEAHIDTVPVYVRVVLARDMCPPRASEFSRYIDSTFCVYILVYGILRPVCVSRPVSRAPCARHTAGACPDTKKFPTSRPSLSILRSCCFIFLSPLQKNIYS